MNWSDIRPIFTFQLLALELAPAKVNQAALSVENTSTMMHASFVGFELKEKQHHIANKREC